MAELVVNPAAATKPAKRSGGRTKAIHGKALRDFITSLGVQFRYDARGDINQFALPDTFRVVDANTWVNLDKNMEHVLIAYLEDALGDERLTSEGFERSVGALSQFNPSDPFLEYLETLPEWDGNVRLRWLISNCFDVNDDDYAGNADRAQHVGALIFGTIVGRALNPGLKSDITPVLVGIDGIGKSYFVEHLVPDDRWFGHFDFRLIDEGITHEVTLGRVVLELPEMIGLRQASLARVKAFLTSRIDQFRTPYAKRPLRPERRWSFVGTANTMQRLFFDDAALMRRFLPVCVSGDPRQGFSRVKDYLDANLTQLWAEAFTQLRGGYEPPEGMDLFDLPPLPDSVRARHFTVELVEGLEHEDIEGFTISDILMQSDYMVSASPTDRQRISDLIQARGYERKRERTEKGRVFVFRHKQNGEQPELGATASDDDWLE